MKKRVIYIMSVSLGSSKRNSKSILNLNGNKAVLERIGTDGDVKKAIELIKEYDGKVNAFGLGGTNLFVSIGSSRFYFSESKQIVKAAERSPIVDGWGIKNTLERRTVQYLSHKKIIDFKGKKVLVVSGLDRFGLSEELRKFGAKITYGDFLFAVGLDIPLHSTRVLNFFGYILAPLLTKLPIKYLYPTGEKEDAIEKNTRFGKYYLDADIICGDFNFIRRYAYQGLENKIIITNTTTKEDLEFLRKKGLKMLITTTPRFGSRSYGTNVIDALAVSLINKHISKIKEEDYYEIIKKLNLKPNIMYFK